MDSDVLGFQIGEGPRCPRTAVRPSLLIGLGQAGRRTASGVMEELDRTHPRLAELVGILSFTEEGLRPLNRRTPIPSPSTDGAVSEEETPDGLNDGPPSAGALLRESLRAVHRASVYRHLTEAGYTIQPGTAVYVAGSLGEAGASSLLLTLASLVGEACSDRRDLTVTLTMVLPADDMPAEGLEADQPVAELGRLVSASADVATARPIDYCYLIDPFHLDRPEQAEGILAAFLALLLSSGLATDPRYEELRLVGLRESAGPAGSGGLCSGIGYSALVLPLGHLTRYCAFRLGAHLVAEGLRGLPAGGNGRGLLEKVLVHAGLLGEGRTLPTSPLVVRLLGDNSLERAQVLSELKRDADGQPMRVAFEPREMLGVPREELVDRVLSLDAHFGRNAMPRYRQQMEVRAGEIQKRARGCIAEAVDLCVATAPAGLQVARSLVKRLTARITEEMEAVEDAPYGPALRFHRQELERAILSCPRRGAVLVLYSLLALVEAYVVPILYVLLYPTPDRRTTLVLVAGLILVNALLAAWAVFLGERRLAAAHRDFIVAVADKYEILIDHLARRHCKEVQEAVLSALEEEERALARWDGVLEDAEVGLHKAAAGERFVPGPLETTLLADEDYDSWYRRYVVWDTRDLAEEFLATADLSRWREMTDSSLRTTVSTFCLDRCRCLFEAVDLERHLVEQSRDPAAVVEELETWARPLLHYSRRLTQAEMTLKALGVTNARETIMNPEATGRTDLILVSTADRERLSCFHTVHGVALDDLDVVGA